MSRKRQNRNTKKMQKALGSKRSRAGYQVGGVVAQPEKQLEKEPEKITPVIERSNAPVAQDLEGTITTIEDSRSVNPRGDVYTTPTNIPGNIPNFNLGTTTTGTGTPSIPSSGREAPIGIDVGRPEAVDLPQMEVAQVEGGPASTTMQMGAVAPAEAGQAEVTQAQAAADLTAAQAQQPTQIAASTMEAAKAEEVTPMAGATGQVSDQALITDAVQGTLTERAAAAQRDQFAEQAAMATAALRPEEKDYVGDVVQGTAESMTAKIDTAPIDVVAAVADLDPEALVSVQMENLLTGLDDGKIPSWARPALAAVEQQLAERGLSTSTVGRDALFNSIIQSAMPLAQSNAQALQARAAQNLSNQQAANLTQAQLDVQMRIKNLDAENQARQVNANLAQQMGLANLSNAQEKAMMNAQINANFDMKQFDFNQQASLANSQFMQTMTMRGFDARQQAAMQNATAMANLDLTNLDVRARAQAQNAQAFLQMDVQNLGNEQQALVLNQQQAQQTLLSNQAAENAARQFNAANQQQADQFMTSLASQIDQYNTSQMNAMQQFNVVEQNRIQAQNAQNATQVSLANAQMETSIEQFNTQLEQQREQFNTANAQAIEQADIAWRRQVNTINTAAQNAANQQNVQNAYGLTMMEQQQLWQQLRDEAAYVRQSYENEETRKTQLYATAIGNEAGATKGSPSSTSTLVNLAKTLLGI